MNLAFFIICFFIFFSADTLHAQTKRFDSTVKFGDKGYRVECTYKTPDEGNVTISPIALNISTSKPSFKINGHITKIFADDYNSDGLPDLIICTYSGTNGEIGSIAAISYNADKTLVPISFPDIYFDPKLREGYKGEDVFSTLSGTLLRKYPIYLATDEPGKPTGGIRTVQYNTVTENGRLTFKVLRSFDVKQNTN